MPADSSRITITLPLALKQALVKQAQINGSSQTQLVIQAIEMMLASSSQETPLSLHALKARVEQLEEQMRQLLNSNRPLPHANSLLDHVSPDVDVKPEPPPVSREPDPVDPYHWNPVDHSFDDWLFQTWYRVSTDRLGHSQPWGHAISVEDLHQIAFPEIRPRRFIDRLLSSEAPGLNLLPDHVHEARGVDCRPQAITFEQIAEPNLDRTEDSGNGSPDPSTLVDIALTQGLGE